MDSPTSESNPYAILAQQQDPLCIMAVRARREAQQQKGPSPSACSWCLRTADSDDLRMFRCKWCFEDMPVCLRCFLIAHMPSPYHRPEEWKEMRWKAVTLWELGYVYQEGHDRMNYPNPEEELEMRVTRGANGTEELLVSKCGCNRE
ncbi:hypothetical protein B0H14DRAFT_3494016 [Mycena olivaceomarginata]|nr:hypothetical protein B0H14DRAFT_3494016 [Mycena olivaceomarginata]